MARSVLIVEDEIFVAMEVQHVLTEMGHIPVGIAANRREALELGQDVDIALVDLNLRDGPTGIDIGRQLAARGATVMFMTANPAQLGDGVPGALGVVPKPVSEPELRAAIQFVVAVRERALPPQAPRRLKLFDWVTTDGLAAPQAG